MGVCFSKKGDATSPTKVPSNDLPKENSSEKEEKKEPRVTEKKPVVSVTTPALSAKKASFVAEDKESKKCEIPVKKSSQLQEEPDCKAAATADEQRPAPLSTSSCTKEELDAILIQCGRLSRSSSGKISKETDGGGQRRYSGSKRSYDFDEERRKEVEDERDNHVSRPSPRRRAPNRERSGSRERGNSRERRVSRSPGKRSDGPVSTTAISDKQKQQPAKMVSVPAREKGTSVNAESGGGNSGVKKASIATAAGGLRSSSPRSRSPANTTRTSNENPQLQSLSRNSSRKADQSPYRRNPLAEIEDNSFRNQNGGSTSVFQKSREVDEGVRKHVSTIYSCQKAGEGISTIAGSDQRNSSHISVATKQQQQLKKQEIAEEDKDPKTGNEIESHNPRTLTRTRSSRRSSRDLDKNPGFNQTSYASLLLEDIQYQQQQHHTAFSLPACISKACSILDAVADLNSSCSDRRSYEADQSGNNGGFARRGLLARREPFVESELVVKDDLLEPSLHKYVTVRDMRWDLEPQESAGSNSFEGKPWSSMWEMNSIDSTGGTSMTANIKDVEDEVGQPENQQQQKSWQRSGAPSSRKSLTAATPLKKKRELEHRSLQQGGHGYGKTGGRAFSLPVSAAST
ncbi:hypothetical protein IEQ34_015939 [Dendrobium chrysotoxum]|uniref:Uncharacterized protein n=1 Tax=Dendrobium chrysotoxum TaxID=161865 RepID=A0AAV7GI63_DENCH|nr:hypothetical protein IEQ34_015939 [Dendrobium chrysotoxum]